MEETGNGGLSNGAAGNGSAGNGAAGNGKPAARAEAFAGLARLMTLSGIALVVVGVVLFFLVGPFLGAITFIGLFDLGFGAYMRRLAGQAARAEARGAVTGTGGL